MNVIKFFRFLAISTLVFSEFCFSSEAPTSEKPPIKIGMSTALSGPAQALGQEIKLGIELYFSRVNAAGGVAGRKLELVALDDQYDPELAGPNMRKLVQDNQILAVIGNVGTPTAIVTVPIANQGQVLLFGAFSGSNILRKTPPDRYVINLRASYEQETASMIQGLLANGIKADEIAFFLQNDSYGDAGYQGAIKALKKLGYSDAENLAVARYTRNTLNIEEGLAHLLAEAKSPKAIIMVGAYAPIAKFIGLAKKEFPKTLFLNVSFVGSAALAKALGPDSQNVIITQVVPPFNGNLPAAHEYQEDLRKYGNGGLPDYGSWEGYLDAKLFVLGLHEAASDNKLTREGIIDTFEAMRNADIGIGSKISFDKEHHQGSDTIWPTIIKNGSFSPLNWSEIKTLK